MAVQRKKQGTQARPVEEASTSVTFFILVTVGVVVLVLGSMEWLQENLWVQGQKLWIISRSAAIAAYVLLTVVVMVGILLSHPRNKDTWRLTKYLLPWHQTLIASFTSLLIIHIFFTVTDAKSGITWHDVAFPIDSIYHPYAMVAGAIGLYSFAAVSITAALRKWIPRKLWLPLHRGSWLVWIVVLLHGLFGGTDTVELRWLYLITGVLVVGTVFWRHWSNNELHRPHPVSSSTTPESIRFKTQ